jgi:arsenite methyltransferase
MSAEKSQDEIRAWVSDYYGKVLKASKDLKTNACCASGKPPKWMQLALSKIHPDVLDKFYGCGFPFPHAVEGCTAVDLGCGAGRDVYVLSQMVGPQGHVIGVDMTAEQLDVAKGTLDWHMDKFFGSKDTSNVTFHQGYIEDLSYIKDSSVDVIVSNCVVNLSPKKDLVMSEVFRILKPGGEFYFSDVFVDRRLPEEVAFDPLLHSECLGGALYIRDFVSLAKKTGFKDPRTLTSAPITIRNDDIEKTVGAAKFTSVTFRLFKLDTLDDLCEDYGQTATYLGTMTSCPALYYLDEKHAFEVSRTERVCANTAAMLAETRLAKHFTIVGNKTNHYGSFDCSATMAAQQYSTKKNEANSGCC